MCQRLDRSSLSCSFSCPLRVSATGYCEPHTVSYRTRLFTIYVVVQLKFSVSSFYSLSDLHFASIVLRRIQLTSTKWDSFPLLQLRLLSWPFRWPLVREKCGLPSSPGLNRCHGLAIWDISNYKRYRFFDRSILPVGTPSNTDIYYHDRSVIGPGMWVFGSGGVTIYAADGSSKLRMHSKDDICEESFNFRTDSISNDCSFIDVASDGHKYVWAAVTQGSNRVDVFDIDTGDHVGALPTCSTPLDLDYNPLREEMWLRCAQDDAENGHGGQIDVWSVNSLSTDHMQVNLTSGRPYGRSTFHSTLGNFGYATAYNRNVLYKINVNTKTVTDEFPLVDSYGAYDMTYSKVNRHLYLRARVCCTCGSDDSDKGPDCGDNPEYVDILTGPSA